MLVCSFVHMCVEACVPVQRSGFNSASAAPDRVIFCSCFPRSRVTGAVTVSGIYVGDGDLDLGLHACTVF